MISSDGSKCREARGTAWGSRARGEVATADMMFSPGVVVIIYHHWCGVASLEGPRAFVFFAVTLLHEKRFTRR